MKDLLPKVKRKRVNWVKVLNDTHNPELYRMFFNFCHCKKRLSRNRIAYYVLKSYYSTTTIDDLISKLDRDKCPVVVIE